jgi:hypothetical protein
MNTNTNTPALALLSSPALSARAFLAEYAPEALAGLSPFALRDATSSVVDALRALAEEVRALRAAADAASRAFELAFLRAPASSAARALRDAALELLRAQALAEEGLLRAEVLALALSAEWCARGSRRLGRDAEEARGARETEEALLRAAKEARALAE